MVVAFIVPTTERDSVESVLTRPLSKRDSSIEEWIPSATDRCDHSDCPSQAYVRVTGVSGELAFCVHHFDKIIKSAEEKLKSFAFDIQDKRNLLIENRLQGQD